MIKLIMVFLGDIVLTLFEGFAISKGFSLLTNYDVMDLKHCVLMILLFKFFRSYFIKPKKEITAEEIIALFIQKVIVCIFFLAFFNFFWLVL